MSPTVSRGIRTILFDAGNTLAFVDLERVAAVFTAGGYPSNGPALREAEECARREMYRRFEDFPEEDDAERWRHYVWDVLECADSIPETAYEALIAGVFATHQEDNLWCSVPAQTADVLDELLRRGYRLGVISNADGRIEKLLHSVELADRFEVIIDSHVVGVEKPDPRIFHIALEHMGDAPEHAVYVGDFPAIDIIGARAAGVQPILLAPWAEAADTKAADCPVIRELPELLEMFPERAES